MADLQDLESITKQVVRIVANQLAVSNLEFYSDNELREKIKEKDAGISEKLESFLNRYSTWIDFHRRVEAKQKEGKLSPDETEQLFGLIKDRDESRAALLKKLGR